MSVDLGPSCTVPVVPGSTEKRGVEDGSGDCGGDTVVEVLVAPGECGSGLSAWGVFGPRVRFLVRNFAIRWSPDSSRGQKITKCIERVVPALTKLVFDSSHHGRLETVE